MKISFCIDLPPCLGFDAVNDFSVNINVLV